MRYPKKNHGQAPRYRWHVGITKRDATEAAQITRRILDAIAAGELTAGSGFIARLEGAAATLGAIGMQRRN